MNLSLVIKSTARATRQAFSMTSTLNLILTLLPNVDTFPLQADRMFSKAVKFVAGLAWEGAAFSQTARSDGSQCKPSHLCQFSKL